MRGGHVPQRTCRGCGRKEPQAALVRYVAVEGRLVEDKMKRLPGKGIYCCNQDKCRERMAKRSRKVLKQGERRCVVVTEEGSV
jgi:predicted RNA-binding protein YlxR (DUF448 family)